MSKFDKIITAIALPIAVGTCVMEPMTSPSWAGAVPSEAQADAQTPQPSPKE